MKACLRLSKRYVPWSCPGNRISQMFGGKGYLQGKTLGERFFCIGEDNEYEQIVV